MGDWEVVFTDINTRETQVDQLEYLIQRLSDLVDWVEVNVDMEMILDMIWRLFGG